MTWLSPNLGSSLVQVLRNRRTVRQSRPCQACDPRLETRIIDTPPDVVCHRCGFTWSWVTTGWDGWWESGYWRAVEYVKPMLPLTPPGPAREDS